MNVNNFIFVFIIISIFLSVFCTRTVYNHGIPVYEEKVVVIPFFSACDIKDLKIIARPNESVPQVQNPEAKSSMRYSAQRQAQQSFQKIHDGQEQLVPKQQQQQVGLNAGVEAQQQAKRKPRTSVGETLAHGTQSSTSR